MYHIEFLNSLNFAGTELKDEESGTKVVQGTKGMEGKLQLQAPILLA